MFSIDRRKLLTSSFGALALSWLPASLAAALMGERSSQSDGAEPVVRGLFRDLDAARAVGRRALELHPHEADPRPLMAALDGASDPTLCRSVLMRRRREELARGQSLVVDGWVLARSEAQLCAWVASDEGAST